tara:strand:- start:79 stop:687 length:609 start_codon:yes stop_codon:yes gene_type:complete
MRLLYAVSLLFFIHSCDPIQNKNSIKRKIDLENGLGQLSIILPSSFDTTVTWINESDNACDAKKNTRIANSKYSIGSKTDFILIPKADSLYELNITQPKLSDSATNCQPTKINQEYLDKTSARHKILNPQNPLDIIEIQRINNRNFLVTSNDFKRGRLTYYFLQAETEINGNPISITFNCYSGNCDDFIQIAKKALNTIKIN